MKGINFIATTLLSLAFWIFFYFVSEPLKANEVPIVVIFSAIIVFGVSAIRNRFGKRQGGNDDS